MSTRTAASGPRGFSWPLVLITIGIIFLLANYGLIPGVSALALLNLWPLILILDVSGSMADYSRHLLQFAYSAKRATARVEVFCFGTRLTRITRALDHRKPDDALERAASAVFDGTEKPIPIDPPEGEMIAVLMPITSPSRLNSGPPELPRLMAASVWM